MKFRTEKVILATWTVTALVVLAAAFQDWTGLLYQRTVEIRPELIAGTRDQSYCHVEVPIHLDVVGRSRNAIALFEDGVPYSRYMSSRDAVRAGQAGSWHMVNRDLHFNSLDGSSPLTNQKAYSVRTPDGLSGMLQSILQITLVILTIAIYWHVPTRLHTFELSGRLAARIRSVAWLQPIVRLPSRTLAVATLAVLTLLVFIDAVGLHFGHPVIALARDDTGSFLSSPLAYLESGEFILTWKRKFLYPVIIAIVVKFFGSLNAVALVQIFCSFLVAGLIVFGTWLIARRRLWSLFFGLGLAHIFLQSPTTTYYNLSLVGEGISPIFIVLAILGFLGFVQASKRNWVIASWIVMALCSEALYFLKPNWGLGIAFPFVALLVRKVLFAEFKLAAAAAYGVSCIAILLAFNFTNKRLEEKTAEKKSFLAQTAFIAHLKQIRPVMERDLQRADLANREIVREMIDRYDEALRDTSKGGHAGYKRIGFNPNLLLNGDRALTNLPHFSKLSSSEQNEFLMHYFIKMVTRRPIPYAVKVIDMFGYLFEGSRIFSSGDEVEYSVALRKSRENLLSYDEFPNNPYVTAHAALHQSYFDGPADSRTGIIITREPRIARVATQIFLSFLSIIPLVTLASCIWEWRCKTFSLGDVETRRRVELALIANSLLLLFILGVGTNAAIYTLKVHRYTEFVMPVAIFVLGAGCMFLGREIWHYACIARKAGKRDLVKTP